MWIPGAKVVKRLELGVDSGSPKGRQGQPHLQCYHSRLYHARLPRTAVSALLWVLQTWQQSYGSMRKSVVVRSITPSLSHLEIFVNLKFVFRLFFTCL